MRLALLGVRGSTPAPGAEFVRYGGHTSCMAVLRDGEDVPALVLDAGTGIRELGGLLDGQPYRGAIVLTHLHWDHLHGLPFCPSVDRDDARVDLYLPVPDGQESVELLARSMSPPHFPIGPDGLNGQWQFRAAAPGGQQIEGYGVRFAEICHRGGLTYGIRVEADGVSLAYLPDHLPADGSAAAEVLVDGVDVLLHDAQFLEAERYLAHAYGHSTVDEAIALARRCRARRLVLTHHAPGRTDDQLDKIAAEVAGHTAPTVEVARQGDVIAVSRAR